jgi:hypothetical protein
MAETARRRRTFATAEEAILDAQKQGIDIPSATDESGKEFLQRPISLMEDEDPPAQAQGKRVKVYHKRQTTAWMSDGTILGPEQEAYILEEDAKSPMIAPHILRLAE